MANNVLCFAVPLLLLLCVQLQEIMCFRDNLETDVVIESVLDINPTGKKTRGSSFALAFMGTQEADPLVDDSPQMIALYVTTEQESTQFAIETMFPGIADSQFAEDFDFEAESGVFSRIETTRKGEFTVIHFPAGAYVSESVEPNIAVLDDGSKDEIERKKGIRITTQDEGTELTVYAVQDQHTATDNYMAISCVQYPTAKDYQYFVFSADIPSDYESQFLITPCEDNTSVTIETPQQFSHPAWVLPNSDQETDAKSIHNEVTYQRRFLLFDTLLLRRSGDLTGSIITSDKPLTVLVGRHCNGAAGSTKPCYFVEQVPPHPTFGDLFFLAPFDLQQRGQLYRIGSVSDEVEVSISCDCSADNGDNLNRVSLEKHHERLYNAVLNRGQYVQCQTPENTRSFCCVQSSRPVAVVIYTRGSSGVNDTYPSAGNSTMIFIPPVYSYLDRYSLTAGNKNSSVYLTYILPTRIFDVAQDQHRVLVNGAPYTPEYGYHPINCNIDGTIQVCAYGAYGLLGKGDFIVEYENASGGGFWGYAYGLTQEKLFGYPLAFEMEPVGFPWIQCFNITVLESAGSIRVRFQIWRGDRSTGSNAYAHTRDITARAGSDYTATAKQLRFSRMRRFPASSFWVEILADNVPEPVESIDVAVTCRSDDRHCYAPPQVCAITIVDPLGQCADLPGFANGIVSYDFVPMPLRPYGTVATYACNHGYQLRGENVSRMCVNGTWNGTTPECHLEAPTTSPTDEITSTTEVNAYTTEDDGSATGSNDTTIDDKTEGKTATTEANAITEGNASTTDDNTGTVKATTTMNEDKSRTTEGHIGTTESATTESNTDINEGETSTTETREKETSTTEGHTGNDNTSVIVSAFIVPLILFGVLVMSLTIAVFCLRKKNASLSIKKETNEKGKESTRYIDCRQLSVKSLLQSQIKEVVKAIPVDIRIPNTHLKVCDSVGQGAFGIVYKGVLIDWGPIPIRDVAVKTLKGLFTLSDVEGMVHEIIKMQEFHHPHVLSLIGVCLDAGPGISMVMPLMEKGNLLNYLKKERCHLELAKDSDQEKILSVRKDLLKTCHQIALGMAYLAEHKFVHRDLAARNCMLDKCGDVKVGDFGLSEEMYSTGYFRQEDKHKVKLPFKWMALESLNDAVFNEKTDVWSYGVTVWEVFSGGRTPYPGVDPMELVKLLREGKRLETPENAACSVEITLVMLSCWYKDPKERPTFIDLASKLEQLLCLMAGYVELKMDGFEGKEDSTSDGVVKHD